MSLRSQAQYLVVAVFGALFVALMLMLHFGLTRALSTLERKEAISALNNAKALLKSEQSALLTSVIDYAGWDDTYQFMRDRNPSYIDSNHSSSTLSNLNVDSMIYISAEGKVFDNVEFDSNGKVIDVAPDLGKMVRLPDPRRTDFSAEGGYSGIDMLAGQLTMFAAYPIVDSEKQGPARGLLLMTRKLGSEEVTKYGELLGAKLTLRKNISELPKHCQLVLKDKPATQSCICMEDNGLCCMSTIVGPTGTPVGILDLTKPSAYSKTASSFEFMLGLILLSALAAFGALSGILVQRKIVEPLTQLKDEVTKVGLSANLQRRVALPPQTDLAALAGSFNNSLEMLQDSQAQLAASQSDFARLYNNTPVMMCEVDQQGCIRNVNDYWLQSLGFAVSEVQGQPLVAFMSPASRDRAEKQTMPGFFQSGICTQEEFQLQRKDGSTLDSIFQCVPERDTEGRIVGALAMMNDVSAQKAARAQVDKYASEMHAITAAFPDLYFKMDLAGNFVEIVGGQGSSRTLSSIIGQHFSAVNTAQASHRLEQAFSELRQGESPAPMEYTMHEGSLPKSYEARFVLLPDSMVLAIVRDTTARRLAEAAHRESDARYRQLVELVQEGIASIDPDETLSFVNPAYARALGYTPAEMIGTSVLEYLDEDGRGVVARQTRSRRRGVTSSYELNMRAKDGRIREMLVHATPVYDKDNNFAGAFVVNTDVTELKHTQQALAYSQKLESLGVLAGGIAHDFNNLLTGILGNASLAAEDISPGSPAGRCLADVMAASRRAADLVRQMLAYAGRDHLHIERFDVNAEVRQLNRLFEAAIPKGVVVNFDLDAEPLLIDGDQAQLGQVLMNLVLNAAEALPDGAGSVRVKTCEVFASASELNSPQMNWHVPPGSYACIEVIDLGCGMDGPTQTKIFEPFFTTKFTGRGLGLAAVLGIIRSHGGALRLDSTPDEGSTFTVYLPLAKPEPSLAAASVDAEMQRHFHGRVLVVDDEPMVRQLAGSMLSRHGFSVDSAEEGATAIEKFRASSAEYVLVLLDMTMPGLNGADTLQQLREIREDIPVIICSGYSETEVHQRFEGLEPDGFVQKPYMTADLLKKISSAFTKHEASHRLN